MNLIKNCSRLVSEGIDVIDWFISQFTIEHSRHQASLGECIHLNDGHSRQQSKEQEKTVKLATSTIMHLINRGEAILVQSALAVCQSLAQPCLPSPDFSGAINTHTPLELIAIPEPSRAKKHSFIRLLSRNSLFVT